MRTTKATRYIFLFLVPFLLLATSGFASADSWWGYGYRSPQWILGNGGTIIRFEIENISGEPEEYKAVLYDKNGKYVEVEYGTKGLFDDAKNGVYKIKADRGIKDKETYHGGRSFAAIEIVAHPGETINLKFDYKKKKVKMTTNYVRLVSKPVAKPVSAPVPDDSIGIDPKSETTEDQLSLETAQSSDEEESLAERVGDLVLSDAMATESESPIIIEKERDDSNIFARIWNTIARLFRF